VIRRIRAPDKMYLFKVQLMCVKNLKKLNHNKPKEVI
jgi:hypothetical protein